ncbi:hypothetical protein ERICII_00385 [Paenibacillus larvae subsp. larvae DSM 25430]|uniref:Uncharacterized protein n=1 Tax=Paenibacillus larvae subsp. larvae TaxID=147375 RepID=A0A6C0QMY9_9BACL|nr:hypothetical protein ERICII_00385 [Paenibacillus larvae subsp. larvae DSM 25430]QHZ49606.1 hypothetical protein ERICV_00403 [Paenibacillus larvae subsp. larvae]
MDKIIRQLIRRYKTTDPFELANCLKKLLKHTTTLQTI